MIMLFVCFLFCFSVFSHFYRCPWCDSRWCYTANHIDGSRHSDRFVLLEEKENEISS